MSIPSRTKSASGLSSNVQSDAPDRRARTRVRSASAKPILPAIPSTMHLSDNLRQIAVESLPTLTRIAKQVRASGQARFNIAGLLLAVSAIAIAGDEYAHIIAGSFLSVSALGTLISAVKRHRHLWLVMSITVFINVAGIVVSELSSRGLAEGTFSLLWLHIVRTLIVGLVISFISFNVTRHKTQARQSIAITAVSILAMWPIFGTPVLGQQEALWQAGYVSIPVLDALLVSSAWVLIGLRYRKSVPWLMLAITSMQAVSNVAGAQHAIEFGTGMSAISAVALMTQAVLIALVSDFDPLTARERMQRSEYNVIRSAVNITGAAAGIAVAQFVVSVGPYGQTMKLVYGVCGLLAVGMMALMLTSMLRNNYRSLGDAQRAVKARTAAEQAAEATARELHIQAHTDALTGLANRTQMKLTLEELSQAGIGAMVLCVDLDDFKKVNDTLGHGVGDELLKIASERILNSCRESDVAIRLGGDEFAVIMPGAEQAQAERIGRRILQSVREPYSIDGELCRVGASVGVAELGSGDTFTSTIGNADIALYDAKHNGKNQVSVFREDMRAALLEEAALSKEIEIALENDELNAAYQPVVDRNGQVYGFEALVRWTSPVRGFVAPDTFLPIAAKNGMIPQIDVRVLECALKHVAELRKHLPTARVNVNFNAATMAEVEVADVATMLKHANLPGDALCIEVTEQALVDIEQTRSKIKALNKLGVIVALDDFGTGYSSITYLSNLGAQIVKLDRSMLRNGNAEQREQIVRGVTSLVSEMGLKVVAEGVESEEDERLVRTSGCHYAQGWLYAKPLSADDSIAYLREKCGTLVSPRPASD